MKIFIFILLFGTVAKASFLDKAKDFIQNWKVKLGLEAPKSEITLPPIPQPKNNPLDISVYEQKRDELYPANKVVQKWPEDKKRKLNIGYLNELFELVQVREPSREEMNQWYNILSQGTSRESLYRAIVLGDRYRHLEMMAGGPNTETLEFTKKYLKKFLQQKAQGDLLKKLDIYRLKKVIVDTTLKTVEVLERKPDHLFRWYGVFSRDLAKEFPHIWKYSLRGNQNLETHYRWANANPLQFIKSEIILKLHRVYNHLGDLKLKNQ